METEITTDVQDANLVGRRFPVLIAHIAPFRLVASGELAQWTANIEEINQRKWDYVKLHEIACSIDVGLKSPFTMVVCRDGTIALPTVSGLRTSQDSVDFVNRCLCALLLGGVYCEAVNQDSLGTGWMIDNKYIRMRTRGISASARFHDGIRRLQMAPMEAIQLLDPRTISADNLHQAMANGRSVIGSIPRLSPAILLQGVTGLARRDWSVALANMWITVEQLLSYLWDREMIRPLLGEASSKSRRDQLGDNRTWGAATRIEMLYQKGLYSIDTLQSLSLARRARNSLAHEGVLPSESDAYSLYESLKDLLKASVPGFDLPIYSMDVKEHSLSDPFAPGVITGSPLFWMAIPKLPGEEDLERAEADAYKKAQSNRLKGDGN